MNEILRLDHVRKYYGSQGGIAKALKDVSFYVEPREFVAIMGPSGSGKTTLLNCVSAIDSFDDGSILLDGKDVKAIKDTGRLRREKLGFVFQDFNLLDTLTVFENIALALTINRVPKDQIEKRAGEAAGNLGIEGILDKYPYQISGGEKQKCACARALVNRPKLILADEPTGSLDHHSSEMLLGAFTKMNAKLGATILMVTHDAFAASCSHRILFLNDGVITGEISRGSDGRRTFFEKILDIVSEEEPGQEGAF